ncbi:MAG: hypothetical protein Kapaf2KO_12500 [Candidatus Kapaibacteriales bacterium]
MMAKKFGPFLDENAGIVAIGDRAGLLSHLIDKPIIQLEGLVMDKQYLELMQKSDLDEIFDYYGVTHYVAHELDKLSDSSWIVKEPIQAREYNFAIIDTIKLSPIDTLIMKNTNAYLFELSRD